MADMERRILHCDMDSFYASVHIRDDPSLKDRPVVVGGNPNGRGVVAAASYAARRFGIHSAMPAAEAKRRCPDTVFIRPDFERYRAESRRIFALYREVTPLVETLSLDEAYLDVTDHLGAHGSATAIAKVLRVRVRDTTGLTVSVGVGPNKLVAKIASDFNKPDGLTVVPPSKVEGFLAPLPIRRIHGIGPATAKRLEELGVSTVADLRGLSLDALINRFGSHGRTLFAYARGNDERPVRPYLPTKSVGAETTYQTDITRPEEITTKLAELATEVSGRLGRRQLAAATITLKVRYAGFETVTRAIGLPLPIADAHDIQRIALNLIKRTHAGQRPVRLLGITGSNLVSANIEQLDLFDRDQGQ